MKKNLRGFSILCLVLAFLFLLPTPAFAEKIANDFSGITEVLETPYEAGNVPTSLYYGRAALAKMNNSTALLYAYDRVYEGVEVCASEIEIYDGVHPISSTEFHMVMDAYRRDHVEHFWVSSGYSYRYNNSTIVSLVPNYIMSGSALTAARQQFDATVDSYLSGVSSSMSDFDKEVYFHDRLAENIEYVDGLLNSHDAYGALVNGKCVCEGYAEALQYLLHCVGIRSFLAYGDADGPHAWNYVEIDGAFYHTDLTWNDQDDFTYHAYFNVTDSVISEDHSIDSSSYPLPKCTSTTAQYFVKKGGYLSSYNATSIGTLLKNNGFRTSVYITGNLNSFISYWKSNISSIASAAGISGTFSYGYRGMGRELNVYITPNCSHSKLTYVSSKAATCTASGQKAYYACTCGMRFWDSAAKNAISENDSIVVSALGHDYSKKVEDSAHLKTSASSCTQYYVYWYTCTRCSNNAKNDSNATSCYFTSSTKGAHKYDNDCDTTCNNCGSTRTVSGHQYSSTCDPSCNVCGATRSVGAHKYDNDCDTSCNECGTTRTITHTFSNTCDTSCNVCGTTRTITHTFSNACDTSCNVCGYARSASHRYDNDCDNDCNTCGEKRNTSGHSFDNWADEACNRCGFIRQILSGWILENGKWAYYEKGQKLKKQWMNDSAGWCYLGEDGYMVTDAWIPDSYGICYVSKAGYLAENVWVLDEKGWRYAGDGGYMVKSAWRQDSKGWCYLTDNGYMAVNTWVPDSYGMCFIGAEGYCETNVWKTYQGKKCYLDTNGSMVKNIWMQNGSNWLYLGSDGFALTNQWMNDSAGWCYLGEDGCMVTDAWIPDSYGICYVSKAGYLVENVWVLDEKGWRYAGDGGYMVKSAWRQDSKGWCYLTDNGYMAVNTWVPDSYGVCFIGAEGYCETNTFKDYQGKTCYLDANGSQVKSNWVQVGANWYYMDADGFMVTGPYVIDGKTYYFEENGRWITDAELATGSRVNEDGLTENALGYVGTWKKINGAYESQYEINEYKDFVETWRGKTLRDYYNATGDTIWLVLPPGVGSFSILSVDTWGHYVIGSYGTGYTNSGITIRFPF